MPFDPVRISLSNGHEYGPVSWSEVVQWSAQGRVPLDATIIDHVSGERLPASTFAVLARNAAPQGVPGQSAPPRTEPATGFTSEPPHADMAFIGFFRTYMGPVIRKRLEAQGFRVTEQGYRDVVDSLGHTAYAQFVTQQLLATFMQRINDLSQRQSAIDFLVKALRTMPDATLLHAVRGATAVENLLQLPGHGTLVADDLPVTIDVSLSVAPAQTPVPVIPAVPPVIAASAPVRADSIAPPIATPVGSPTDEPESFWPSLSSIYQEIVDGWRESHAYESPTQRHWSNMTMISLVLLVIFGGGGAAGFVTLGAEKMIVLLGFILAFGLFLYVMHAAVKAHNSVHFRKRRMSETIIGALILVMSLFFVLLAKYGTDLDDTKRIVIYLIALFFLIMAAQSIQKVIRMWRMAPHEWDGKDIEGFLNVLLGKVLDLFFK